MFVASNDRERMTRGTFTTTMQPRSLLRVRLGVTAATAFLLLLGPITPAFASPGGLDTSFGGDGRVTTAFGRGGIWAVAIQSDGKIVAAGATGGANGKFALARYTVDGSLDATFGGDGKVKTGFTSFGDSAYAVALQSDGKIVAAGSTGGANGKFALARYNTNGRLDATFSGDGKATTDFTHHGDYAYGVAIQTDGTIVAAGATGGANRKFALARYTVDGSLDTSFGGDGKVKTDFTRGFDEADGVAIQTDGKIVAAGFSGGANGKFALARYKANGILDPSFGSDGKVVTDFSSHDDYAIGLAIQGNGKIVAAGGTTRDFYRFALARYNTDGTLDPTFSKDGRVTTNFSASADEAHAVAIQSDGKIIAAGHANGERNGRFALARYNSHGHLDPTFGGDGRVTTGFTAGFDSVYGVAIQADGRIVAAGVSGVFGRTPKFALARFQA
jgi:uncharacterized delta-60 repeat protein